MKLSEGARWSLCGGMFTSPRKVGSKVVLASIWSNQPCINHMVKGIFKTGFRREIKYIIWYLCVVKKLGISWKDRPKKIGPFGDFSFSSSQLPHDAKVTAAVATPWWSRRRARAVWRFRETSTRSTARRWVVFFSGGEKLEISWFVKGWNSHEQWGFFLVIRCYIEQLSYETTLIIEVNGMVIVWFNSDIICYNGDITIKHDWMMSFVVRNHQQT